MLLPDAEMGAASSTFNFDGPSFEENKLLRHIIPSHAEWLELDRLAA